MRTIKSPNRSEVQLGDVLRIALPLSTQIYAAEGYARRSVSWVSLLTTTAKVKEQAQADDIVIIPPALQQMVADPELHRLLQELATFPIAAVIFFTDISAATERIASELDLPLLQIVEPSYLLRDVHKEVAALLVDRQTQISERGMQLYRELSEMSRDGSGLDRMADLIAKLTGKIVAVQDKRLEVRTISRPAGSIPFDDDSLVDALCDQENLPAVLRNRKAAAKATRGHWQQLIFPNHNVARIVSPIISGDRARGYLSIIGAADELDLLDAVAVEQGAAAIGLEMAKAKAISEAKKALRGDFLEGLLAGTLPDKEVERLASRLDHNTEQPHAVMTFRWADQNRVSLRRMETTLNWLLSSNQRPTLVHLYGGEHVTVFQSLRSNEETSESHRLARRLRSQLESEYPDQRLVAGMSGPVDTLADWPQAHREALQAMEVGQRLSLTDLVDYNSLGVYRLLSQLDDVPAVHNFTDRVIGPLVAYDRQHRSNLVQTIEEYFNHHGNVSQTAESLFIHRNTLLYRLDRIQELTGHQLNHSDQRLALHLALKLWQLRPET